MWVLRGVMVMAIALLTAVDIYALRHFNAKSPLPMDSALVTAPEAASVVTAPEASFLEVEEAPAANSEDVDKQVLDDIETLIKDEVIPEADGDADDAVDQLIPEPTEPVDAESDVPAATLQSSVPVVIPPNIEAIQNDLLPKYNDWIKKQAESVVGMAGQMKQKAVQIHVQARELEVKGTKINHLGKKLASQADSMLCVAGRGHCDNNAPPTAVNPPAVV
eukprot:Lankesteria_metandrocarpae@DN7261_c0_g1_i1.p1